MKSIEISPEDGVCKYKSKSAITGEYWVYGGKPTPEFKQQCPVIAGNWPGGGFRWLIPVEDWISRKFFGEEVEYQLEEPLNTGCAWGILEMFSEILRDWQKRIIIEALETLDSGFVYRKGLIAGLGGGKTLVALILGQMHPKEFLYIAPRHLWSTIREEATKWDIDAPALVTPESAKKIQKSPTIAIVDECLSLKNPDAQRSQGVTKILSETPVVISMTGTPMAAERCKDLRWLRVLGSVVPQEIKQWYYNWGINPHPMDARKLGSRIKLTEKGEPLLPIEVDGWKKEEISEFLAPHLSIVDISDILAEIPEATYQKNFIPAPHPYRAILRGLLTIKSSSKRLTQARTASSGFVYSDTGVVIWLEKEPGKVKWVKKFLEDNPEEPVVIFSHWRAEIEKLIEVLQDYNPAVVHDVKSSEEITRFTSGGTNLMICSASITEGMNLQRSRIGIFCSNSTSPYKRVQAEGRLYRQGQTRGVVFYDLVCSGTLDERALVLLQEHREESEDYVETQLAEELRKIMRG